MQMPVGLVFELASPTMLAWLPTDEAARRVLGVRRVETLDHDAAYCEVVIVVEPDRVADMIARVGQHPLPQQQARRRIDQCRDLLRAKQGSEAGFLPLDFRLWPV